MSSASGRWRCSTISCRSAPEPSSFSLINVQMTSGSTSVVAGGVGAGCGEVAGEDAAELAGVGAGPVSTTGTVAGASVLVGA